MIWKPTCKASYADLSSFMSSSASPSSHSTIFSASGCAEKRLSRLYGRCESMTWSVACSGSAKYSERSTRDPKLSRMIVRSCDEKYTRKQCQLLHHHTRAKTCDRRSSVPLAVLRLGPFAWCCMYAPLCCLPPFPCLLWPAHSIQPRARRYGQSGHV